jgi:hypothetical protein
MRQIIQIALFTVTIAFTLPVQATRPLLIPYSVLARGKQVYETRRR